MSAKFLLGCTLLACAVSTSLHAQFNGATSLTQDPDLMRSSTTISYTMVLDEFYGCKVVSCVFAAHHFLQRGTDVKQDNGSGALLSSTYRFSSLLTQWVYPGSCYDSHSWASFDTYTGSRLTSDYYRSTQICVPVPGLPPGGGGGIVLCDPGHPDCGGNGGSDEPLILDLNGDGIHTTRLESAPVLFDMNADGYADLTAWTDPLSNEGLLFYDRNRNRVVDGNQELFGNRTMLPDGSIAATGVDALGAYDLPENRGNGDGAIGPGDAVWGTLRVWVDRNHDGVASESETYSLGELGVEAIELAFERFGRERSYGVDQSGNFHFLQGYFRQRLHGPSGVVYRQIHDVFFRVQYSSSPTP